MLLQELQVEGFRSLKSVTWKPGRLNVLIGPNGGGKSNLLRALELLRLGAGGKLSDSIIGMGGMGALVWDGVSDRMRFRFRVLASFEFEYICELDRLGNTGGYQAGREELWKFPGNKQTSLKERIVSGSEPRSLSWKLGMPYRTELALSGETFGTELPQVLHPDAWVLRESMRAWSVYSDLRVDQEAELRRAIVTRSEKRVNSDGQNLIAVLHTLYTNDRNFEEFLDNTMKAAFPGDYEKLTFPPAEHGRTEMRVRHKHRKGTDSTADLSDGTLRFLLLVAILGSTDPAPLIAIDEPEAGLHPRMMSIVAEIAANAAVKTQVIFATHSPQFLDAFHDDPEDLPVVTVVTSNGSETELKNIEGEELKRWVADYSLGKFAFSGEAELAS